MTADLLTPAMQWQPWGPCALRSPDNEWSVSWASVYGEWRYAAWHGRERIGGIYDSLDAAKAAIEAAMEVAT